MGFGDDNLYDALVSLYDKEGERADARLIIKQYVLDQLVPADHFTDTLTPEMKAQLSRTVSTFKDPSEKQMTLPGLEKEPVDAESITFEDIKPFIEQHLKDGGDKTTAIKTAIENFNADKLSESRTKIVEAIKSKVTKEDTGFNIAGVEGEVERITQLANYQ